MKLYVEGGGDTNLLKTACRNGFSEFLRNAGLAGKMPRIVACGSRSDAYHSFCIAIKQNEPALLLVDSETLVTNDCYDIKANNWQPWRHLKNRRDDNWEQPDNSTDDQCHLMVQCMESWFMADIDELQKFFGQDFRANSLPSGRDQIEALDKKQMLHALVEATKQTKTKGKYAKGKHSFKILALIDPEKVANASPWARRFIETIKTKMDIV